MEMPRQPFWPYSSFFSVKPQPQNQYPVTATKKAMKRKNHKNPEEEIECEQEESKESTEFTISCEFSSKTKKPRTSETSFTATSPIEKKPLVNAIVALNMINFSEREQLLKKKNHSDEEVSTELTLFDQSWITKKRNNMGESAHNSACTSRSNEPLSKDALEAELNKIVVDFRISVMKYFDRKEEQEKRRMGVSAKPKLHEDPFKIKKKLTKSDLGNLCRLLVKTSLVKDHILPYLSTDCVNEIESKKGARVMVWDQDTKSVHQLTLKRWRTSKSYVFIDKWSHDFVHRRDLKEGDEIGLFWDPYYSRFNFCVLERAPRNRLAVC